MSSARRRQARGWARSSPSERPSRRVSIGSSSSDGRLVAAPAELDRAHRRAARRRRQDAPAGVGEEDRVDQLRLAARELGDEGDDELLVAEALAQRGDLLAGVAVAQVVLGEEAGQRRRARRASAARQPPRASRLVANDGVIERSRRGSEHRSAATSRSSRDETLRSRQPAGRFAHRAPRPSGCAYVATAAVAPLQRRWQPGQKKVARCALHDAPHRACRSARTACPRGRRPAPRAGTRRPCRARRGSRAASSRRARRARASVARTAAARRSAARPADAVAARARIDAGLEQRLAGVDVAGADDDRAAEQRLLDRDAAPAQRGVQMGAVEAPGRTARGRARRAAWPPAPASAAGDQTTAPKRRGSVRRSVPRAVTRSKWSCGPGAAGAARRTTASPTCRGASAGRRARAAARGTCRAALTSPTRLADERLAARSRAASAAACRRAPR